MVEGDGLDKEHVELLASMRQLLVATTKFLTDHSHRHGVIPAEGSPGEAELAEEDRLATEHFENPVRYAQLAPGAALLVAIDHVRALAAVLQPPTGIAVIPTHLRIILDTTARAWWMFDPDIDVDERHRRAVNERLHNLRHGIKVDRAMGNEDTPRAANLADVIAHAKVLGLDVVESTTYRCSKCGAEKRRKVETPYIAPARPDGLSLVAAMAGPDAGPTTALYHLASGSLHGAPYAVLAQLETVGTDKDGLLMAQARGATLLELVTYVGVALNALMAAVNRRLDYMGHADKLWLDWKLHVWRTVRPHLPGRPDDES